MRPLGPGGQTSGGNRCLQRFAVDPTPAFAAQGEPGTGSWAGPESGPRSPRTGPRDYAEPARSLPNKQKEGTRSKFLRALQFLPRMLVRKAYARGDAAACALKPARTDAPKPACLRTVHAAPFFSKLFPCLTHGAHCNSGRPLYGCSFCWGTLFMDMCGGDSRPPTALTLLGRVGSRSLVSACLQQLSQAHARSQT